MLSIACHFHGLLALPTRSGSRFPVLLKLHRADVVQCRVHPGLVIPEQPVQGCILGLSYRLEALAVQALDLQRAKQRLAASVVPTVSLAAHGGRDAMPLAWLPHAGCFAAP